MKRLSGWPTASRCRTAEHALGGRVKRAPRVARSSIETMASIAEPMIPANWAWFCFSADSACRRLARVSSSQPIPQRLDHDQRDNAPIMRHRYNSQTENSL